MIALKILFEKAFLPVKTQTIKKILKNFRFNQLNS